MWIFFQRSWNQGTTFSEPNQPVPGLSWLDPPVADGDHWAVVSQQVQIRSSFCLSMKVQVKKKNSSSTNQLPRLSSSSPVQVQFKGAEPGLLLVFWCFVFPVMFWQWEKHLNCSLSLSTCPPPPQVSNSASLVVSLFSLGNVSVFPLLSLCCLTTSSQIHKHKLPWRFSHGLSLGLC